MRFTLELRCPETTRNHPSFFAQVPELFQGIPYFYSATRTTERNALRIPGIGMILDIPTYYGTYISYDTCIDKHIGRLDLPIFSFFSCSTTPLLLFIQQFIHHVRLEWTLTMQQWLLQQHRRQYFSDRLQRCQCL